MFNFVRLVLLRRSADLLHVKVEAMPISFQGAKSAFTLVSWSEDSPVWFPMSAMGFVKARRWLEQVRDHRLLYDRCVECGSRLDDSELGDGSHCLMCVDRRAATFERALGETFFGGLRTFVWMDRLAMRRDAKQLGYRMSMVKSDFGYVRVRLLCFTPRLGDRPRFFVADAAGYARARVWLNEISDLYYDLEVEADSFDGDPENVEDDEAWAYEVDDGSDDRSDSRVAW